MTKTVKMLLLEEGSTIPMVRNYVVIDGVTNLDMVYEDLRCNLIDIISIKADNGRTYDIICDDEGLLRADFNIVLYVDLEPVLAGGVLITRSNEQGENIGLDPVDVRYFKENIQSLEVEDLDANETFPVFNWSIEIKPSKKS